AEILEVSDRTVRRYLNSFFTSENNAFSISQKMVDVLKNEHLRTDSDIVVQEFTQSEYDEFYKRLSEYPILKDYIKTILNELEYHKKSAESQNRQLENVLLSLRERNLLEAKSKGFDKEN
ncbi:hypothetical protein, partial [Psychrobacter sp. NPDC077938]|uniref:hypothetical protein n=1 Tax=Psychrobacter sp. NPDC077938 TaxID=3364494 RepID=UPI0037C9A541